MGRKAVRLEKEVGGIHPVDLARRHFDVLNGTSTQKWFVDGSTRKMFVDEYVGFIKTHGAARFEELARSQEVGNVGWANNVALRKCLQRESESLLSARDEMAARLGELAWIGDKPIASQLVDKAVRCSRANWVFAKAEHIDGMDLSPSDKAARFDLELAAALAEQNAPENGGL